MLFSKQNNNTAVTLMGVLVQGTPLRVLTFIRPATFKRLFFLKFCSLAFLCVFFCLLCFYAPFLFLCCFYKSRLCARGASCCLLKKKSSQQQEWEYVVLKITHQKKKKKKKKESTGRRTINSSVVSAKTCRQPLHCRPYTRTKTRKNRKTKPIQVTFSFLSRTHPRR